MSTTRKILRSVAYATLACALSLGFAYAFPSLAPHPNDADSIAWERDGTKDGSSTHNHYADRSFGGLNDPREPYTAALCWDDTTYRVDLAGPFDDGHCFIDEFAGGDHIPRYVFAGAGWPAAGQARVREAMAAWGAIESGNPQLLTGIAYQETATAADADMTISWTDIPDTSGGGRWVPGSRTLELDSSYNWYFPADPMEGDPAGIQPGQWHFYSVVLHETGHITGLVHQTDADLMDPPVGQPPDVAGHRYFTTPDADSTAGVHDLYSQPHRRITFVIDDTGSMGDEIGLVKTTVRDKVDEFVAENLLLRYHLLTYKDDVTYRGSTTDAETIKSWVDGLSASGGGDCPEEMLGALNRIAEEAPYSDAWVMTDAGFHGTLGDLATTIFNLIRARVTVHPIVYSTCFRSGQPAAGQGPAAQTRAFGGLGPEAFGQVATETGGHFFQISTGETQAAASILLNEMVATAELAIRSGELSGGSETYGVFVESANQEANFLLNGLSGSVSLALRDPSGVLVEPGDPGVTYTSISNSEYYQVAAPQPGLWQAEVSGTGSYTFSASGTSPINFELLSDTSLAIFEDAQMLVALAGLVKDPVFTVTTLEGDLVETLELFDDGMHGDGSAGDGTWGGTFTPSAAGSFRLRVQGTVTDDGSTFERVAPQVLRIQTLDVAGGTGTVRARRGTFLHAFEITNLGPSTDTFSLTVSDIQGWADLSGVPSEIAIGGGETVEIEIPVTMPADADEGDVDEIVLAAVSTADPFLNDAASVFTVATSGVLLSPTYQGPQQGSRR